LVFLPFNRYVVLTKTQTTEKRIMESKLLVGIIGLGKFGFRCGEILTQMGNEVLGVDSDPARVKRAQQVLTQTYEADASDRKVLEQLGFADLSYSLVSVGESIEASVMISMYLKELGTTRVWVKAVSADHEKLLRKIGVDEVILPEIYAARQLALRMAIPGFIDFLPFGENMALREVAVENWAGRSLREIDMTNRFQVQVIALKRAGESRFQFVPGADEPLRKDDMLAIMGSAEKLAALKP
jgi:trk system potassium uptake protein TrkA